jgi:hypothetical protein
MSQCRECKWWLSPELVEAEGLRESGPEEAGWGVCSRGTCDENTSAPADPGTLAYAYDWRGRDSMLCTRPNFGCVMFEAKE